MGLTSKDTCSGLFPKDLINSIPFDLLKSVPSRNKDRTILEIIFGVHSVAQFSPATLLSFFQFKEIAAGEEGIE